MHTDHAVDDELEPCQSHAVVRDRCEIERAVGIADVHHDLDRDVGQLVELDLLLLVFQQTLVDVAFVALGAGHGDLNAIGNLVRRVAAADHRRDAEFARDDRRVAGAPAAIRHDRGGTFHHRLPVGVGHVGNEDIAALYTRHFADITNDPGLARADLLADAAPARDDIRAAFQREPLQRASAATLHRLRACLQDVQVAILAVLAPFDVHRALVVVLDSERILRQLENVVVGQRETLPVLVIDIDGLHTLARRGVLGEDHLDGLAAKVASQDRIAPVANRGLVDVKLIGVDGTLHDGFTESP